MGSSSGVPPEVARYLSGLSPGTRLTRRMLSTLAYFNVKEGLYQERLKDLASRGITAIDPQKGWTYRGGIEHLYPSKEQRPQTTSGAGGIPYGERKEWDGGLSKRLPLPAAPSKRTQETAPVFRETVSSVPRDPLYEKAYEFWDPNQVAYVARVAGIDNDRDVRVHVRILTPSGISNGTLRANYRHSDRTIYRIVEGLQPEQLVLVRKAPNQNYLLDTMEFEPLLSIKPEDNVTKDGKPVVTSVDDKRILNLPITGQSVKYGVASGVGQLEKESFYMSPWIPVFVAGGESKIMVPEAAVIYISRDNFVLAEAPMTYEERTDRDLRKLRYCIDAAGKTDSATGAEREFDDPSDWRTKIDGAEKLYIRSLGILGRSPLAMRGEAEKTRNDARHIVSRIAAVYGMDGREKRVIQGFYPYGSADYEQLMREISPAIESHLAQLAERKRQYGYYSQGEIDEDVNRERTIILRDPFTPADRLRFFDAFWLGYSNRSVKDAAGKAFEIATNHFNERYDWRGRFSLKSAKSEAVELIDEQLFWDIVGNAFHGTDVDAIWNRLAGEDGNGMAQLIMRPYVEKLKRVSA